MSIPKQTYYTSSDDLVDISKDSPLTYIEWLQYENSFSKTEAFEQYNIYLTQWYDKKGISSLETQTSYIRNIYINLLKQITLEYTTSEEKRFLSNIDYDNDQDLDVALPFFAKKLKQIALYYASKRDEIKFVPTKVNLKGSDYGMSQLIISEIADILKNDTAVIDQLANSNLTIQDVLTNLDVNVVDLYDTEQNYYNIPNEALAKDYTNESTNRYNYFNMSSIPDSTRLFMSHTFNEALIELIRDVPVNLHTGTGTELREVDNSTLAISDIITGTELDRLDDQSFSNYLKNGELNISYEKLAFQKYSGTDYYYLSTGDTLSSTTSGQLFKADKPHRNLLNKFRPTILASPGENLYKREFLGGFFTTHGIGLINYTTLDYAFDIELEPNTIKYFPDPTTGARGYYSSYDLAGEVVKYYENVNWHKCDLTNHYSFGIQNQIENLIRFNPYQSIEDTRKSPAQGVFRFDDEYDFWSNTKSGQWTQSDIFPKNDTGVQPISSRQEDLLLGDKNIYSWRTDIYGNDFALVKTGIDQSKLTYTNTNNSIYETEYIETTASPMGGNLNCETGQLHTSKNLTEQKQVCGELHVRLNTCTSVLQLTSSSVSGIYSKYKVPGEINYKGAQIPLSGIATELENCLLDMDVIYDTVIFETEKYIVFEKILYNYETSTITSGQTNFSFIQKDFYDNKYEYVSNWWFDEPGNRILVAKTTVHPSLSSTTNRMIYPEIYTYDLSQSTVKQSYPDPDLNPTQLIYETNQYSLSSVQGQNGLHDIINVGAPVFTYNKDSQRFQIIQMGHDPAENMYMFKNDFRMYDQTIEYIKTSFYHNNYFTYTVNSDDMSIDSNYFTEINTNISVDTWHYTENTIYLSCTANGTTLTPVENSSSAWTYGNNYFNFTGNRDIVMSFDFAMSGTLNDRSLSANGLSVIFYKARKVENIKNYKGGLPAENYEVLDHGGLGPAFTYYPDISGTSTNLALTGLDSAHAAVILDATGNIAGDTSSPSNSVVTLGPYDTRDIYKNVDSLDVHDINLWQPLTGNTYEELKYIRCKVVLTNLGRTINVYMKSSTGSQFKLVSTTNISSYFSTGYESPGRMKVSLASNTSTSPGIIAIKNITITGEANTDDSLVITT